MYSYILCGNQFCRVSGLLFTVASTDGHNCGIEEQQWLDSKVVKVSIYRVTSWPPNSVHSISYIGLCAVYMAMPCLELLRWELHKGHSILFEQMHVKSCLRNVFKLFSCNCYLEERSNFKFQLHILNG